LTWGGNAVLFLAIASRKIFPVFDDELAPAMSLCRILGMYSLIKLVLVLMDLL
jgi:hypothetical protein